MREPPRRGRSHLAPELLRMIHRRGRTERKMRNLIYALATLLSVVMVAAGAAHSF